jgi:hypothetical protein
MQIVIVGLFIINYAGPVQQKLMILGALSLGRFGRSYNRKILLNIGNLYLESVAGKSHILLGCGDVTGKPEEKICTGDIGKRISKSYMAPVNDAPISVWRNDYIGRIEVAVAKSLSARH